MNSEPTRRGRTSSRADEILNRSLTPNFDLTVYGSPAPRCSQRPASVIVRRPKPPPNTPKGLFKERKPLQLPIEKILLLNEKNEREKAEKIKLELSSRQIKLTCSDEESEKEEGKKEDERNRLSCRQMVFEDTSYLSSSTVDLSIDLSSVTHSENESEGTSEGDMEISCHLPMVPKTITSRSPSTSTGSPKRYVWHLKNTKNGHFHQESVESSETGYPFSPNTKSCGGCATDISSEVRSTDRSGCHKKKLSPRRFRSRSADLICLYVSTIDNQNKLTKYFRPCHVCKEACCKCPDIVPESSRNETYSDTSKECEIEKPFREDKTTETDPEITEFRRESQLIKLPDSTEPNYECYQSVSRNSGFSNFLVERYMNKTCERRHNDPDMVADSGISTIQLDDTNESVRSPRGLAIGGKIFKTPVPMTMIHLATAAQCARVLANSLESVLEAVDSSADESLKDKDFVRFKNGDLNQLFETLLSLRSRSSGKKDQESDAGRQIANGKFIENEEEKKWINWNDEESLVQYCISDASRATPDENESNNPEQNADDAFRLPFNAFKNEDLNAFEDDFITEMYQFSQGQHWTSESARSEFDGYPRT